MDSLGNAMKQFNWVDIFFIILLIRIIYVSIRSGLVAEFFKLLGVTLSIYISMHYYTGVSDFLRLRLNLDNHSAHELLNFICFVVLAAAAYMVSILVRAVFSRFIKAEALPELNRWAGLSLGGIRAIMVLSLITFIFSISTIQYVHKKAKDSYLGGRLIGVSTGVYRGIWEGLMSKFMVKEKFNKAITEARKRV